MLIQRILAVALAAAFTLTAQDAPILQQLASAIYAQETSGDLDEAIRLYRQILAAAPQRTHAAEAQFRLAQSLLQKGDLRQAAAEYQILASNYPEQQVLIASLAQRVSGARKGPEISLGNLDPNTRIYKHKDTGIEITIPKDWLATFDTNSSGGGQMIGLGHVTSGTEAFVWMRPYDGSGSIDAELQQDLATKHTQRTSGWKIRPESIRRATVSGEQSIAGIADYTEDGKAMVEYLVWVRNPKARLLFSARLAAKDLPANESLLSGFVSRIKLPN